MSPAKRSTRRRSSATDSAQRDQLSLFDYLQQVLDTPEAAPPMASPLECPAEPPAAAPSTQPAAAPSDDFADGRVIEPAAEAVAEAVDAWAAIEAGEGEPAPEDFGPLGRCSPRSQ